MRDDANLPDTDPMVKASEIRWTLAPPPPAPRAVQRVGNLHAFPEPRTVDSLVIRYQADETDELRERIVSLETDLATARELICATLDALRDVTVTRDRLREQHYRLLDEYRHLRGQIMRQAAAA